jgi:cobalt-zinc-cadmium efflux system membrane fusion protein
MTSFSCPRNLRRISLTLSAAIPLCLLIAGCKPKDQGDGAPPPAQVVTVSDMNLITIDKNDVAKFPVVNASQVDDASQLTVTGAVFPDISREVPVISLANGRVVDIKTRSSECRATMYRSPSMLI